MENNHFIATTAACCSRLQRDMHACYVGYDRFGLGSMMERFLLSSQKEMEGAERERENLLLCGNRTQFQPIVREKTTTTTTMIPSRLVHIKMIPCSETQRAEHKFRYRKALFVFFLLFLHSSFFFF